MKTSTVVSILVLGALGAGIYFLMKSKGVMVNGQPSAPPQTVINNNAAPVQPLTAAIDTGGNIAEDLIGAG